jgi:L-ascorbate oxidase
MRIYPAIVLVFIAHIAAAKDQPQHESGAKSTIGLAAQETSRTFFQPQDLMGAGAPNSLFPEMDCQDRRPTVKGNDISVTLKIGYSDHTIWNPNAQKNDKVHLRTYNDCLVAPTLTVHPDNRLRITLKNTLPVDEVDCPEGRNTPNCPNAGNLHTHGLHVSPAGNSDNVLISIDPQTTFTYQYDIPRTHPAGTFWYHSHRHGSTALSVSSGMEGVLIIRGDRTYQDRKKNDGIVDIDTVLHTPNGQPFPERVMLFQQIAYGCFSDPQFQDLLIDPNDGHWICPKDKVGVVENFPKQLSFGDWQKSGRFTQINGKVQPVLTAHAGEIERWRMVHGGVRDTIDLKIVKAATSPEAAPAAAPTQPQGKIAALTKATTSKELATRLQSLTREQLQEFTQQTCTGENLTQYEIAVDGLTRSKVSLKTDNVLNPGQRSDTLVVFPSRGLYCVLDEAAPAENTITITRPGQRPTSKERQLLAFVIVHGDKPVTGSTDDYLKTQLIHANATLPPPIRTALGNFDLTTFTPPQYRDLSTAVVAAHPSAIFDFHIPPQTQDNTPVPDQPAQNPAIADLLGLVQNDALGPTEVSYNPATSYVATLGTVDEWKLGSARANHVFHIHINPFEIMDIKNPGNQSIFNSDGSCIDSEKTNVPFYCDQRGVFRDTLFIKQGYTVTARTRYDDFIGEYVLHCHILDHEDQGMMMNVTVVNPNTLPSEANAHTKVSANSHH